MWCYDANFEDIADPVEVRVNKADFNKAKAKQEAEFYATAVGRIPKILRTEVKTLTIHDGELFGGGSNDILIHTAYSE